MLISARRAAIVMLTLSAGAPGAFAQAPSAGQAPVAATHKHYDVSDHALQPGPNGDWPTGVRHSCSARTSTR